MHHGISALAAQDDPLGTGLNRTELAEGLVLDKITATIGVHLMIFESRPDCMPQIAALALRLGNGLLLKGGKEAEHSNRVLHRIVCESIVEATGGRVSAGVVGLVTSRADIPSLLALDGCVDLVIPRGSGDIALLMI